jgi:short subunit dehydrogenase-like uncharacterized protein
MSKREYDVIVWGATGFTGELVVEYLAETYGVEGDLRWAIAGRNQQKLEAVRNRYLATGQRDHLGMIIADSDDAQSLADMVARTRVICTTVGPYAKYGTPLVAACAEAGTHYCDLTGEVQWMARVIPEYEDAARASGARIVHTCGFDSVPFDMGVWYLQQQMQERHGVTAKRVKGRVAGSKGGASGGTIASILNMIEEAKQDPSLRRKLADPYVLYPAGEAAGQDGRDQTGAVYDPDFEQWTSPFIMAGEDFRYDEAILNKSGTQARLVGLASGVGMLAMVITPTRKLMQRFLPQPGEGPNRETRESGYYEVLFLGIDPDDRDHDLRVRVTGDRDPGYGSTSKILGEAAVCLARDDLAVGGGFWTPASALGNAYVERLQARAGVTFEVVTD